MSGTDQGKPAGKSGRRKGKGDRRKKAVSQESLPERLPESPAPVQLQGPDQEQELQQPQPDHAESSQVVQQPAVAEQISAVAEQIPAVAEQIEAVAEQTPAAVEPIPAVAQIEIAAAPPEVPPPAAPPQAEPLLASPAPAELAPVSLQTIANAYRDYTRKSFEEFGSFFEQLSGARSLDKAMTVHTEFVKRAYETSVAESQRICELHNRLAQQTLKPLQGMVGKGPETRGKS